MHFLLLAEVAKRVFDVSLDAHGKLRVGAGDGFDEVEDPIPGVLEGSEGGGVSTCPAEDARDFGSL